MMTQKDKDDLAVGDIIVHDATSKTMRVASVYGEHVVVEPVFPVYDLDQYTVVMKAEQPKREQTVRKTEPVESAKDKK